MKNSLWENKDQINININRKILIHIKEYEIIKKKFQEIDSIFN